jgi:hypothetical protein
MVVSRVVGVIYWARRNSRREYPKSTKHDAHVTHSTWGLFLRPAQYSVVGQYRALMVVSRVVGGIYLVSQLLARSIASESDLAGVSM